MEEAHMAIVDITLDRLGKVALLRVLAKNAVAERHLNQLKSGQVLWLPCGRPHVDPDDVALLDHRVADRANLLDEVGFRRLVRDVDTRAGYVELPAVIDAAQSKILDT